MIKEDVFRCGTPEHLIQFNTNKKAIANRVRMSADKEPIRTMEIIENVTMAEIEGRHCPSQITNPEDATKPTDDKAEICIWQGELTLVASQ